MKEELEKAIAYVFEECTGKYHFCDDTLGYLDARGQGYKTVHEALEWARYSGYTHYKRGNRTRKL